MFEEAPAIPLLLKAIHDPDSPIGMRMRSAYYLRQAYSKLKDTEQTAITEETGSSHATLGSASIIRALTQELKKTRHGSLMRHEFAYVLGQLQDEGASEDLQYIVKDTTDCVMVRHEAAEALGAIGDYASITAMQHVCDDPETPQELRETCQLSVALLKWKQRQEQRQLVEPSSSHNKQEDDPAPPMCACMQTPYSSVDPGLPPSLHHASLSTTELGKILLDEQASLEDRYQSMFALRNRGGSDAVQWLGRALLEDTKSALLRHEVAYVLGQIQHPESVEALEESLRRTSEHKMVRHESAEALGAIDGRWEVVERILREFTNDADDVVRESCLVALDAADYWGHSTSNGNEVDDAQLESTGAETSDVAASSFAQIKADQRILVNGHFNRVG